MARMIYFRDSFMKCSNSTRRHIRRCNQISGADRYAQIIKPKFDNLNQQHLETLEAVYNRIDMYDDMLLQDSLLDNCVRNSFRKCEEFDRSNSHKPVLRSIFPEETFGPIIKKDSLKEVYEVEQIIVKIEAFGQENPIFPIAAELKTAIAEVNKARNAFNDSVLKEKIALAEEDIVKEVLCKQFEANYLDARKEMGRKYANSLFPNVHSKKVPMEVIVVEEKNAPV